MNRFLIYNDYLSSCVFAAWFCYISSLLYFFNEFKKRKIWLQIRIWRNNSGGLSWSIKFVMLGNLLSLAFAKQDSLNDGLANSIILRNFDNTWLLDNLFTRDHLYITSLENLLCKKVTY